MSEGSIECAKRSIYALAAQMTYAYQCETAVNGNLPGTRATSKIVDDYKNKSVELIFRPMLNRNFPKSQVNELSCLARVMILQAKIRIVLQTKNPEAKWCSDGEIKASKIAVAEYMRKALSGKSCLNLPAPMKKGFNVSAIERLYDECVFKLINERKNRNR